MRIHDSFVVHQLVPFVLWMCVQVIGFWIAYDLMGFGDLNLSGFEEGCLDFVLDILTHDVIVELGLAFAVKSEPSHLALNVSLIGGVTVVFGTPAHKFFDVLIGTQPGVHVVSEQPLTGVGEMPDFVDVLDLVPQFDGFV